MPDPRQSDRPGDHSRDPADCPVDRTLRLLGGRWRLLVLFNLGAGSVRWGQLRRKLTPITPRVLTATLRSLEADGLVWRHSEGTIPPAVRYGLTARGVALDPVFHAMAAWGTAVPVGTADPFPIGAPDQNRTTDDHAV